MSEGYDQALVKFVDEMPDIVKFALVGLHLSPPRFGPQSPAPEGLIELFDHFVTINLAVLVQSGDSRTYRLTEFGTEVYNEVATRSQSDGSLPANDTDVP
jgi:hypothetical protein